MKWFRQLFRVFLLCPTSGACWWRILCLGAIMETLQLLNTLLLGFKQFINRSRKMCFFPLASSQVPITTYSYKCPCKKLSTPPSTGDSRRSKSDRATALLTTIILYSCKISSRNAQCFWHVAGKRALKQFMCYSITFST